MFKPYPKFVFFLACIFASALAQSSEPFYVQQCAACHGQEGEGNAAIKAPAIAGLDEAYLLRQLTHFKNKVRGNHPKDSSGQMMMAVASSLSEKDIQSISRYLAIKPFKSAQAGIETGGFMGRGLYMNCQSCHGAHAQGETLLNAPRLAGQHTWYLKAQLEKFQAGIRGKHSKDKYGKQMHIIAVDLDMEQEVDKILGYIAHRKIPKKVNQH